MKVYYAHSLHLYNTPQEKRDVELLEKLGFQVINPNTEEIKAGLAEYRKKNEETYMNYFKGILDNCDTVAFRTHIDGKIPAGVGTEIKYMIDTGKPVFQLPNLLASNFLDVAETRQYLQLNGQR